MKPVAELLNQSINFGPFLRPAALWRVVLCNCGVSGRAGQTEKQAWANWNKRARGGNLPPTVKGRRALAAYQAAIRNSWLAARLRKVDAVEKVAD